MVPIVKPKGILILTPFFAPNIGGVETHLTDLVFELNRKKISSFVLTYSPLTTKASAPIHETVGYCKIIRLPWIGKNLFHRLENLPLFDFLYLTPYLLVGTLIWLSFNHKKISTIHSHGINAMIIGLIMSKIFTKNHLVSTHAIYENINGFVRNITVRALNSCSAILCLSRGSLQQLINWGVQKNKLHLYRYWLNLNNFYPADKPPSQFTVLYSGRLINKKGVKVLIKVAKLLPMVSFIFAGNGPLATYLDKKQKDHPNLKYLGQINYRDQPNVYRQASILCIPSQYTEGYGRSAMEAVASGIPVVGSNLGSIGEAVNSQVSILVKPTALKLKNTIESLYFDKHKYNQLRQNCRHYAQSNFSQKNFNEILKFYN